MQTELLRMNKHHISVLIFVLLIEAERSGMGCDELYCSSVNLCSLVRVESEVAHNIA